MWSQSVHFDSHVPLCHASQLRRIGFKYSDNPIMARERDNTHRAPTDAVSRLKSCSLGRSMAWPSLLLPTTACKLPTYASALHPQLPSSVPRRATRRLRSGQLQVIPRSVKFSISIALGGCQSMAQAAADPSSLPIGGCGQDIRRRTEAIAGAVLAMPVNKTQSSR